MWPGLEPPVNQPLCGFDGSLCAHTELGGRSAVSRSRIRAFNSQELTEYASTRFGSGWLNLAAKHHTNQKEFFSSLTISCHERPSLAMGNAIREILVVRRLRVYSRHIGKSDMQGSCVWSCATSLQIAVNGAAVCHSQQ